MWELWLMYSAGGQLVDLETSEKTHFNFCRGWSTTLLNSIGAIYAFGVFNGLTFMEARGEDLKRLSFPPAYPPTTNERYEPSTAISQYSTGRSHVLGLADDGKIWMWTKETAFLVKPLHVDVVGRSVKRVVAG